jgi:hypothetical protein
MILGPVEVALIGLSAVVLSLLGYWAWMGISGWLADRRWRRGGIDRRGDRTGRRSIDAER